MNTTKTLFVALAVLATGAAGAHAQSVTVTAAPANFPGDTFGASAQIGTTGPKTSHGAVNTAYLDIEGNGPGNGPKYESFGVIDFTNAAPTFAPSSVSPAITISLFDAPFSVTKPGVLDFYLATSNAPVTGLAYQTA